MNLPIKRSEYSRIKEYSRSIGENNDCVVIAVSIACGISYTNAHLAVRIVTKRVVGKGVQRDLWKDAFRKLGYKLIPVVFKSKTVVTLEREFRFRKGTYIVCTSGHIFCIKNGVVEDWTKGKRHKVEYVYEVTKTNEGT